MGKGGRGGAGRGQGRNPVKQGEETVTVSLRMTAAQRDKLSQLGGADWVRKRIDKAKAPNAKVSGERSESAHLLDDGPEADLVALRPVLPVSGLKILDIRFFIPQSSECAPFRKNPCFSTGMSV